MNNKKGLTMTALMYIIGGILIGFGVIIAIFMGITANSNSIYKENFSKTSGVITEMEVETVNSNSPGSNGSNKLRKYHIQYKVGDEIYTTIKTEPYSNIRRTRDHLIVYYDPAFPSSAQVDDSASSNISTIIISLLLVAAGFAAIIFGGKFSRKKPDDLFKDRFKSYDEYSGDLTEKAGTLFDREVKSSETRLPNPTLEAMTKQRSRFK